MTKFLLIRHGAHDLLGKVLAGRMPGVSLNSVGQQQATALPERLAGCEIHALYSSPMDRCRETAAPLAQARHQEPIIDPAFHEIDFGTWTSRTFTDLHPDAEWQQWNTRRSLAQPPCGEAMATVQSRFIAGLHTLAGLHDGQTVAIFSHGDPIKSALLHFLGSPLDHMPSLEISPASLSVVHIHRDWHQVTLINSLSSFVEEAAH
jgi:broad specificity phosphatase PhoE